MAQKTTVEWLEDNLIGNPHFEEDFRHNRKIFQQAKQMEKEQIKKAYKDYHDLGHIYGLETELYYNETYGENKD